MVTSKDCLHDHAYGGSFDANEHTAGDNVLSYKGHIQSFTARSGRCQPKIEGIYPIFVWLGRGSSF